MKKIISIMLSLAMVVSLAVVATTSVSAETLSKMFFTMDEDSRSVDASITQRVSNFSYTDLADGTHNYVAKINRTSPSPVQDQAIYFKLPSNVYSAYGNVKSIKFDVATDTGNFYAGFIYLSKTATSQNSFTMAASTFSTTWKTVTIDMTTAYGQAAIANNDIFLCIRNTWSSQNTCANAYIDNIAITYDKFVASFTGANTSISDITADENNQVTLPDAAIDGGEFGGWVTEADPDTILTPGTKVTLTADSTYIAVASVRENQEAPEAPVLESASANSITLVANSNCEYSLDGTTWQNSNIFTGLSVGTSYTFYQRYKSSAAFYASPSSPALTASTLTVYTFEAEKTLGTYNGNVATGDNSDTSVGSLKYVMQDSSAPTVGHYMNFNFTSMVTGVYTMEVYARCTSNRSTYTFTGTDASGVAQELGDINFAKCAATDKVTGTQYYYKISVPNAVTVSEAGALAMNMTISKAGTGAGCYLDKFVLTKVADYVAPDETPTQTVEVGETTKSVKTQMVKGGAMRYFTEATPTLNGIRFSARYNTADIQAIIDCGYEITDYGTTFSYNGSNTVGGKLVQTHASGFYKTEDGYSIVAGSMVGIKDDHITGTFSGIGYLEFTSTTDENDTITLNSIANDNERSIAYIAYCVQNGSEYDGLSKAQQDQVDTYADKYVA